MSPLSINSALLTHTYIARNQNQMIISKNTYKQQYKDWAVVLSVSYMYVEKDYIYAMEQ